MRHHIDLQAFIYSFKYTVCCEDIFPLLQKNPNKIKSWSVGTVTVYKFAHETLIKIKLWKNLKN